MGQELVSRLEDAVSQLGKVGGEVRVVYTPNKHPNVPGLEGRTIIWETPAIDWQESGNNGGLSLDCGAALKSFGVDEQKVLSGIVPDSTQSARFLRNSVGLDLARIGVKKKGNRERVVFWLFKFFDISFPRELREDAFKMTWDFLRENLEYVNESDADEAEAFSNSMMQLPPDVVEMAAVLSSPCSPIHSLSLTSASSLPQLDTSTESNQVVVEDADFSYTATYLDLEQVDHLQSLLSPSRAPPLATSDSHLLPPTSDISFPSPINREKRPHEKSPGASASEDEIGSKRLRRPPNHLKEFTTEKPW